MKSLCADMGGDISARPELDATVAKGILDRQSMAKVRHIDVNVLRMQEQCAEKFVPLHKIPAEENGVELMTKHLANPVIVKHIAKPNLEYREGRAVKAAMLHSTLKAARQKKAKAQELRASGSFSRASE